MSIDPKRLALICAALAALVWLVCCTLVYLGVSGTEPWRDQLTLLRIFFGLVALPLFAGGTAWALATLIGRFGLSGPDGGSRR